MPSPVPASVERLLRAARTPGLQYVVVDRSQTLMDLALGQSDLESWRPMTSATLMMAYSMSKTITAAAVLRLVGEELVDLDDPIDRHGVSHPYGPGVTVRQLLSHTAGLPDPIPLRWVHPVAGHPGFDERAALTTVLERHPRLASTPGRRYKYSNIGYWLLGRLVEEVSGIGFTDYVTGTVLRPLGEPLDLDDVLTDAGAASAGYLERYSMMSLLKGFLIDRALIGPASGRWVEIRRHYVNGPAFGGLVGTARGFAHFLQDQLAPTSAILEGAARDLFYEPQHRSDGTEVPMTLGWHVGRVTSVPCFYKEGGGGGFHCMMRLYPSAGIGSVLMANATGLNVGRLMDQADGHVLGGRQTESGSS